MSAAAQESADPAASLYTLHVFADLIQIPTLVLSESLRPLPPLSAQSFNITLDAGPKFRPTHVRAEGDDPISLALLIDASGSNNDLLRGLPEAAARFATESLQPHDHISVYAVDCSLVRSANDVSANGEAVKHAISAALASPALHGSKQHSACAEKLQLWNALAPIVQSLSDLPGRRVVFLISDGKDRASKVTWSAIKVFAVSRSITLFGLSERDPFEPQLTGAGNLFDSLCQSSGGLRLETSPRDLLLNLKRLVELLRGRYILEFPRPGNAAAGEHVIDVKLVKQRAFIRTAGITVPLRDAKLADDPKNVPFDPSRAPVMGDRRAFQPHLQ